MTPVEKEIQLPQPSRRTVLGVWVGSIAAALVLLALGAYNVCEEWERREREAEGGREGASWGMGDETSGRVENNQGPRHRLPGALP